MVQVVRRRLDQEESLPEDERPTAVARSYYLKVMLSTQTATLWEETNLKYLLDRVAASTVLSV